MADEAAAGVDGGLGERSDSLQRIDMDAAVVATSMLVAVAITWSACDMNGHWRELRPQNFLSDLPITTPPPPLGKRVYSCV